MIWVFRQDMIAEAEKKFKLDRVAMLDFAAMEILGLDDTQFETCSVNRFLE